jgi:thiamine biosynthesis lipoprotein
LGSRDPAAQIVEFGGPTMGTSWKVRLALSSGMDVAPVRDAIDARLALIVDEMSHWQSGSVIDRFNTSAAGSVTRLPPDFRTVIKAALDIAERSNGAFDPTFGALADRWGFGPSAVTTPPDDAEIRDLHRLAGWRRLTFGRTTGALMQPGSLHLDLSGIAKGHAVDAVADVVTAHGFRHFLVEIGGELVGRGIRPDGTPWWVELELPPGIALPVLRIALHELAVATSGDYVRGAHTIDPATGYPTANGMTSVSVLHPSAMIADGWASALTVLGAQQGLEIATREGLAARMIVRDKSKSREVLTPALLDMI